LYRHALNERPEARFRSVRELYEDFVALLAPAAAPRTAPPATAEVPAADAEAVVEDLEPISDGSEAVAASTPAAAAPPADPGSAPIAAAALPRFESPAVETPRHTREVVALDPPEWTGTGPASTDASRPEGERWSSLRLWDAESDSEGEERAPRPSAAEATGPELPVNTQPARALVGSVPPPPVAGLAASEEEAERAVAGLTEIDGPVLDEEGHDEPLLAEALGVDLVVDGDEPVPEPVEATPAAGSPVSGTSAVRATPTPVPVSESSVHEISPMAATPTPGSAPEPVETPRAAPVSATPPPSPIREVPRLVPESRPWNTEPRPPPYRREAGDGPRTREAPTLAARSGLPPAPSIPPLRSAVPRLSPVDPPAAAGTSPTPLSVVPEPSPTRQERVVAPPPPPEALAISTPMGTPVAPARGAGSWSPAELLAQVIAEIQAEERGAGLPRGGGWEPVPLDATQPISTDEVAARLAAAEAHRPAPMSVDDEDLPAMRHEAGRAGMRMALLTAVGLIIGLLGGWTLFKLVHKPPRPQVEQISEVRSSGQAPAPR
jgi:hypothetical protein